jgi:hypothetical protein
VPFPTIPFEFESSTYCFGRERAKVEVEMMGTVLCAHHVELVAKSTMMMILQSLLEPGRAIKGT